MKPLFIPGVLPILGERPSIDPQGLDPGHWIQLLNLSGNRYNVAKRWGHRLVGVTPPVAGAGWRGGWEGQLGLNLYSLHAFQVSTKIRIYSLNLSSYAWTEVTDSTTRLNTVAFVQFAAGRDPGTGIETARTLDVLVAGNGSDDCLVIRENDSGTGFLVAAAPPITYPINYKPVAQPYPQCWFNIQKASNVTYTAPTGAFTNTANTTSGTVDNEITITMDTSATGVAEIKIGDASQLDYTNGSYQVTSGAGAFDLGSGSIGVASQIESHYVGFLVEDTIADPVFQYLTIELRDGSTYRFIWAPNAAGKVPVTYLPAANGVYLAVFDLTLYLDSLYLYTNIDRIRLSVDHALSAGRTFKIIAVMGMGKVPAGAQHIVAVQDRTTLVESGAKVCTKILGPGVKEVGGNVNRNFLLPEGARGQNVGWTYIITTRNPGTNKQTLFYRQDPNESRFFLTGVNQVSASTAKYDSVLPQDKYFARTAPSAFNTSPPKGSVLCESAGRIFIGAISSNLSQVWVSDQDYPLRFTGIPRDDNNDGIIDPDSGTVVTFGKDRVWQMVSMPGSVAGRGPVLVFTNSAMYRIEGPDALSLSGWTLLNPHGTIFPHTVAVHKSNVYYVDAEKQPRVYTGASESYPLGIWKIESLLKVSDLWNAHAFVSQEQYRLYYRGPSMDYKRNTLIYEERTGEWWEHDTQVADGFAYCFNKQTLGVDGASFSTAAGTTMIGITNSGYVYELEQVNYKVDDLTDGSNVPITITMKTFLQGQNNKGGTAWNRYAFGQPGVIWDKGASGTLTVTLQPAHNLSGAGAANVGTMDLVRDAHDQAWRYFLTDPELAFPEVNGYGCYITITGDPESGKACHGIILVKTDEKGNDGADVDQ